MAYTGIIHLKTFLTGYLKFHKYVNLYIEKIKFIFAESCNTYMILDV